MFITEVIQKIFLPSKMGEKTGKCEITSEAQGDISDTGICLSSAARRGWHMLLSSQACHKDKCMANCGLPSQVPWQQALLRLRLKH